MTEETVELTDEEREAAKLCGMTPREYFEMKSPRPDWDAVARETERHEKLKADIRARMNNGGASA